jgi:hypothetical protein
MGKADYAMTRYPTAALVVVMLAGCGGGVGTGIGPENDLEEEADPVVDRFGPVEVALGQIPAGLSVTYDPAAETVTVDDGTGPVTLDYALTQGPRDDPGRFYYYAISSQEFIARQETTSGRGLAMFVRLPGSGMAGAIVSRVSDTEMPVSGSAAFTGSYIGGLFDEAAVMQFLIQRGKVTLMADFEAAAISGEITDRTIPGMVAAPVRLGQATIADGDFAGTTTGGAVEALVRPNLTIPGTSAAPGTYSGLFTGADGQEIVGSVAIPHLSSGNLLTEYGAFVAERSGP